MAPLLRFRSGAGGTAQIFDAAATPTRIKAFLQERRSRAETWKPSAKPLICHPSTFFIHKGINSLPLSCSSLFPFLLSPPPPAPGYVLPDWNHAGDLELPGLEWASLSLAETPPNPPPTSFCGAQPKIKVRTRARIKETIHHAGSRSDQTAAGRAGMFLEGGGGWTRLSEDLLEHGDPGRIAAEFLRIRQIVL